MIDWKMLTESGLLSAIEEVLHNDKYQRSVTRLSGLIMDQPQHPLDRTVWWMEYILRLELINVPLPLLMNNSLFQTST